MNGDENKNYEEAVKELEELRAKVEKADDIKARLVMERHDEEDAKKEAKKEMMEYSEKQQNSKKEFDQNIKTLQNEIQKLSKQKKDLLDKLKTFEDQLEAQRAEATKLKEKFKINAQIPHTDVKFLSQMAEETEEEEEDSRQLIRGVFTISQRAAVLLRGGQALLTFEEERVASKVLKMTHCLVSCENTTLDVKPEKITIDTPVKFQVHLDVSRKELDVLDIPPVVPEERMKDRLEMSFSRPSRGGGEVERVDYDENTGTGHITFLHPGVAVSLAMRGEYSAHLDSEEVILKVGPTYKYDLQRFQTFCGRAKRTILLDGIEDAEDEEDLQDHLEIHFQKPNNGGGEIENIKYISKGKALQAFFCEDLMD